MRFAEAVSLVFECWREGLNETPFTLLGPPGIGKTTVMRTAAGLMTRHMREKHGEDYPGALYQEEDLSSDLPEDIGGIPYRETVNAGDKVRQITRYAGQEWQVVLTPSTGYNPYGVLCLDDLTQAPGAVQVATRKLVLTRNTRTGRLSDQIAIGVTGNRRSDGASASMLPSHFRNSVCIIDIKPDIDSWSKWYKAQTGLHPMIPAFLRYKPEHLSHFADDADKVLGSFATPRTWEKLGRVYATVDKIGLLHDTANGLVGSEVASEFMAYVKTRSQLVDPELVLQDPEKNLPNPRMLDTPDKRFVMAQALGEYAALWVSGKDPAKRNAAPVAFLRAVGWVTDGEREFAAPAISAFTAEGGQITDLITGLRSANKSGKGADKHVGELGKWLLDAMSRGGKL